MATPRQAPSAGAQVNFGDSGMYAAGGFLPDGNYIVKALNVVMFNGFKPKPGDQPRLGVLAEYLPLKDPKEENVLKAFYSMGGKADQSFAPNPETGKGLVSIPGAQGGTLQENTNWDVFRKSWLNSGLPNGIFTNDLTVLEGAWVHITSVDPPEERKSYQSSATAEVQQEARKDTKIAVVTEIMEGGAPWEGGGGIPKGAVPTAKAPAAKAAAKAPVAQAPVMDADVAEMAANCISDVLESNPNGLPRLKLSTETFRIVAKKFSDDAAGLVAEAYFKGPKAGENLPILLGELGYKVEGNAIKPA